jgi:UDP-N-acetylmuramyl pentapeptide phosphotransferase/UDP-N-acetylglucosamine-1-phosphate transferase
MKPVLAFAVAFLVPVVTLPLLAKRAARWGLVDAPTPRSTHVAPVARVGGLGLFLGLCAGCALWLSDAGLDAARPWLPYLVPALGFFVLGFVDDLRSLAPGRKFLLQAALAALAVLLGLRWAGTGLLPFGPLGFGAATPVLTWVWILAVGTMVNFLDGLDLITVAGAAVLLAAGAGAEAGPGSGALYGLACAAVLGLTCWNATPALVFPGDGATHLLGFLVASLALCVPGSAAVEGTAALPWVVASAPLLPGVIDVAVGLFAKARRGVPLSQAHNQHLSQRLARASGSHARVALRYGVLAWVGLWLVVVVAPRWGLPACLVLALLVLGWHLGSVLRVTRKMPYVFPAERTRGAPGPNR